MLIYFGCFVKQLHAKLIYHRQQQNTVTLSYLGFKKNCIQLFLFTFNVMSFSAVVSSIRP